MAQAHEILGVAANADEAAISAAFRKAAKQVHPDLNNGNASGLHRLRRLIAARNMLAGQIARLKNGAGKKYNLPALRRELGGRKPLLAAFAGLGASVVLAVLLSGSGDDTLNVTVVPKTGMLAASGQARAARPQADEEAAEFRAIRDMREVPGYSPPGTEPDTALDASGQGQGKRQTASPAEGIRKVVKGAAGFVSKTFQKIASEL